MSEFNPQVAPTQDPNFFRYSEPIKNIEPNKSSAIALTTLGEGVEGAVKLGDQAIKGSIDEKVKSGVDTQRDAFTSSLEAVRNNTIPQPVQTPAGSSVLSFADDSASTQPAPAAIDAALGKVSSVQSALEAGKVNDTYYTQQTNSIAKSLRAQYPGYRDYIDEKMAQMTGGNPANQYMQNLMQDINRQQTSKKTEYDKVLDLARGMITAGGDGSVTSNGVPGAVEQYNRLIQDPSSVPQFLSWYGGAKANQAAVERDNLMRANRKGSREEIAQDDEQKFTGLVGKTLDTNFHSQMTIAGSQTPQGILDFVKDADAHPEAYKSAQFETWATTMKSQQTSMATQLWAEANKSRNGIPSYAQTVGTAKVKEIIDNQVNAVYGNIISALNDKDAGRAYESMRQVRAYQDDVKKDMFASPMGRSLAVTKVFNDQMGPAWASVVTTQNLKANIDDATRDLLKESTTEGRTQMDFATTGKTVTMKEQLDRADELVKKGQMTSAMKGRYTNNLVNIVDDIKDPKAPVQDKINVVRYLFSPEGQGLLSHIKTEYPDPTNNNKVALGKYSVFNRLTSDDIVQNVATLAKSDSEIGRMYKNYLENEAGSQLFYKELQNLNHFTGHDDLHFKYDNDIEKNGGKFIKLLDKDGKEIPTQSIGGSSLGLPTANPQYAQKPTAGYLFQVQQIVDRVNSGLSGLGRVEKGFNGDVNEYLLNFMQHAQVNLGQNWSGLPQKLADAIAASRTPQRRIEDTFKDAGPK